jgi:hypothetical protein
VHLRARLTRGFGDRDEQRRRRMSQSTRAPIDDDVHARAHLRLGIMTELRY